ncbi:MAG: UDP-3-O-acyl-N-acetylglucosamine deacetylase [Gammaproteobacteria bacterium]|nr:UDP-3-O-acyl-N-acetylglucosamine deacetylase [Gammaproteobacteria bacterium]
MQQTLRFTVQAKGLARYSAQQVQMRIHPAAENCGIVFDVLGWQLAATLADAMPEYGLSLGQQEQVIRNCEKLLAAMYGVGIDNAVIELNYPEVPEMDGGASSFVALLHSAGVVQQTQPRRVLKVESPLLVQHHGSWARVLPAQNLRVACLRSQGRKQHAVNLRDVVVDIRRATFESCVRHAGAQPLPHQSREGGDTSVFNRHDVLACLADLSLLQVRFQGMYVGCGANRALNLALLRRLMDSPDAWIQYVPGLQAAAGAQGNTG